jgi:ketosteroid isomerase-like protein
MTQTVVLSQDRVKAALDTYYGGLSRLDMAETASAFAPDGIVDDPKGSEIQRGRAAIETYFSALAAPLESFSIKADAVHTSGDGVAVSWSASWKGRNGRSGNFAGIDVLTLNNDGLITQGMGFWDAPTVLGEMNAP